MKKTFFVFAVLFFLSIIAGSTNSLSNQDFSITNKTGMILVDVFISHMMQITGDLMLFPKI